MVLAGPLVRLRDLEASGAAASAPKTIHPRPIPRPPERGLGFLFDARPSRLFWFAAGAAAGGWLGWRMARKYGRLEDAVKSAWASGR